MNNLKLYDNTILVKADKKTQDYLIEWSRQKRDEWVSRQKKIGIEVDISDLEARELQGEVLPYEKALIPQFEEIKLEFREALEDHGAGVFNDSGAMNKNVENDANRDVSISETKANDKTTNSKFAANTEPS